MTSGTRRQRIAWLGLAFVVFVAIQSFANVGSTRADLARAGIAETAGHVWTWELSSVAMWVLLMPAIGWMVVRIRPPRVALGWAALAHAAATVPLSLIHVFGMIAIRIAVYAAQSERYTFGSITDRFLYEYRKDVTSYLLLAAFLVVAHWLLARPASQARSGVLLVPDGSVTHRVPIAAIDWAAAAGNYVEIAWGERMLLHRSTLAALAEQLGPGFVRIHRGRLVRRDAVRSITTERSGDFAITLTSGTVVRGSRRFRAGLGA